MLRIVEPTLRVKDRLSLSLSHRRQTLKPRLRRAEPELVAGHQLISLTKRADAQAKNLRIRPHRSRVDRRAAVRAERLLAFVSALSSLDVDLRRARRILNVPSMAGTTVRKTVPDKVWQSVQWQITTFLGSTSASNRIFPQ